MLRLLWTLLILCSLSYGANILFANTWQSKSHALTMKSLAERLHVRGHNVSMYNVAVRRIGKIGDLIHSVESVLPEGAYTGDQGLTEKLFWFAEMEPRIFDEPHEFGVQYLSHITNDENLLSILNTPFDLVILDEMFPVLQTAIAFKLKEKFGSKVAIFSTTDLFALFSRKRGLSRNPVTYPNYYIKGYHMLDYEVNNFALRVITMWDALVEQYFIGYKSNNFVKDAGKLLDVKTSFERLFEDSLVSFMDYPSRYGSPTPRSVDLVYVGEHCQEAKPLPPDFLTFVNDPKSKGTIYIAFGSIVNWKAGPPEAITTFVEVLNKFSDYRVIWSFTGPELKVKSHILITKWAPQNDVLHHPKTVLFFTHGGLKSLKEGICGAVPMLFLPFFADQPKNALYAMKMGIAEAVYKRNITVEEVSTKMTRALRGEQKENINKFRSFFVDNVIDPRDLGVFWAERVMKFNSNEKNYYKIKGRRNSWITYLYIDFIVVLVFLWGLILHK